MEKVVSIVKEFVKNTKEKGVNVDSIIVEQNGKIKECVLNQIDLHELRSCGKVLVAMAYGIAINERFRCKDGKVLSLNTKVYETLKSLSNNIPVKAQKWTIKTLLTHQTGYDKMYLNEAHVETLDKFKLLDVVFDIPLKYEPNKHFVYSNVEPYMLSVFFKENFGRDIAGFIDEKILKPIGIKNFVWENFGNYCAGATASYFNYKDFHKIGKLLLDYGKFNGKQIVPENWVKEMVKPQVHCPDYYKPERLLPKLDAGYFMWISRDGIVFRDGSDGQYIICDYKNNMLITIMSSQKDMSLVTECLRGLI